MQTIVNGRVLTTVQPHKNAGYKETLGRADHGRNAACYAGQDLDKGDQNHAFLPEST